MSATSTVLIYKLLLTTVRNIALVKLISQLPWTRMSSGNWLCMVVMPSRHLNYGSSGQKRLQKEVLSLNPHIKDWVTSVGYPSLESLISQRLSYCWRCTFQARWLGIHTRHNRIKEQVSWLVVQSALVITKAIGWIDWQWYWVKLMMCCLRALFQIIVIQWSLRLVCFTTLRTIIACW